MAGRLACLDVFLALSGSMRSPSGTSRRSLRGSARQLSKGNLTVYRHCATDAIVPNGEVDQQEDDPGEHQPSLAGDARRPEDLNAVLSRDGHHARRVGRLTCSRRKRAGLRRLGKCAHEVLEAGRLGDEEEAGFGGGNGECMRDIARPVHERSSRCLYRSATDPKGQVAFDDVEPFVLTMMNVQGRAGPLGSEMLDHGDAAAGHLARGLDRGKDAEEPERLTLILPQGNRVGYAAGGVHGSSFRTTGDLYYGIIRRQHAARNAAMALMLIHHRVKDYDAWRPLYDAHENSRASAGITNGRVFRKAEDPNDLVILFDAADVAKARSWTTSEDLKSTMQKAGVLGPPTIQFIA